MSPAKGLGDPSPEAKTGVAAMFNPKTNIKTRFMRHLFVRPQPRP
jgi:hypothetical protein